MGQTRMPSRFQMAFFVCPDNLTKKGANEQESSRLRSVACQPPDRKDPLFKFHKYGKLFRAYYLIRTRSAPLLIRDPIQIGGFI